jgi:Winged helix-turn-helix DNA-binding
MEFDHHKFTPAETYARRSISKQDWKIITALDEVGPGGLTRYEISERTQISVTSVSARCNALLRDGLLVPKIIPDTLGTQIEHRKTPSGGLAAVLILNTPNSPEVAE